MRLFLFLSILALFQACSLPYCTSCYNNRCIECKTPYQQINGYCVGPPCLSQNCQSCDSGRMWCQSCNALYELKSGQCRIATYVIVIPIIVFIVILGACAFCCLFKSYRSNQKKLELKHLQSKSQALEYSKVTPTKDSFIDNPHFQFKYEKEKQICAICLQGKSDMITECDHYFHYKCFSQWVQRNKRCPVCNKKDLVSVVAILCMKCKNRYYDYQISQVFALQIQVDSQRACKKCSKSSSCIPTRSHLNLVKSQSKISL